MKRIPALMNWITLTALSGGAFFSLPAAGVTASESLVYSFQGGNSGPNASTPVYGLTLGSGGAFYGTTLYGGSGNGTVYRLTPSGSQTLLYSLDTNTGYMPTGTLLQGANGDLYGTAYLGGAGGSGTIFKVSTAGVATVLHAFTGTGGDGERPSSGVVRGADGNLYGTSQGGGDLGAGTVFRVTPVGEFTVMHSLSGNDGSSPSQQLLLASDGNFYGTTSYGGTGGNGTVFKMTPSGVFSVVYSFQGSPDGALPAGPLIEGTDGNFYGVTFGGGTGSCSSWMASNCGTVYKLTPDGQESVLHSFSGGPDDGFIATCAYCTFSDNGLIQGSDGYLYGLAQQGGSQSPGDCIAGCGMLFQLDPRTGAETVLYSFMGSWDSSYLDGWAPSGSLLETSPGVFYGNAENGGQYGWGAVFKLSTKPSAPVIQFEALPKVIKAGQDAYLYWSATDATSCVAVGGWATHPGTQGRQAVQPQKTGVNAYTISCTGPGGSSTATAYVKVN